MAKVNLSEEARKAGLPPSVVISRVNKLGWSVEKAVNTPVRQKVEPSSPVQGTRKTASPLLGHLPNACRNLLGSECVL